MAFSRTAPRHELTYLRRRPRPGEGASAEPLPAAATKPAAPSLDLSGTSDRQPPRAPAPPRAAPLGGRRARGRTVLSRDAPSVTLDRRQSAIGSLAWDLVGGGELACAWELADGEAGLVSERAGVQTSPEFGRRPIVGRHEGRIVIGLRHVHRLRRILLVATALPARPPARLIGDLHDGGTIESAHAGAEQPVFALVAGYQVDGELHLRLEHEPFGSEEKAAAAYGFALTWLPPVVR